MQNEKTLGFIELPIPKMIFIGGSDEKASEQYCWYFLGADSQIQGIPHFGLRGTIEGFRTKRQDFKGKPNYKLDIFLNSDRKYIIRSGIETIFTRGLLLNLTEYLSSGKDLKTPLIIGVKRGEGNVVFNQTFGDDDKVIRADWDKDMKLLPLIWELQKNLGQNLDEANCEELRPKEKGAKKNEK